MVRTGHPPPPPGDVFYGRSLRIKIDKILSEKSMFLNFIKYDKLDKFYNRLD